MYTLALELKHRTLMSVIDLDRLIKEQGLKKVEIARQLFPTNKFPLPALERILRGESSLSVDQASKLSTMTGIPIADLFNPGTWRKTAKGANLVFEKGQYKAVLSLESGITYLYHDNSFSHEFIMHSKFIPLSEYVYELESQIEKIKKS